MLRPDVLWQVPEKCRYGYCTCRSNPQSNGWESECFNLLLSFPLHCNRGFILKLLRVWIVVLMHTVGQCWNQQWWVRMPFIIVYSTFENTFPMILRLYSKIVQEKKLLHSIAESVSGVTELKSISCWRKSGKKRTSQAWLPVLSQNETQMFH